MTSPSALRTGALSTARVWMPGSRCWTGRTGSTSRIGGRSAEVSEGAGDSLQLAAGSLRLEAGLYGCHGLTAAASGKLQPGADTNQGLAASCKLPASIGPP